MELLMDIGRVAYYIWAPALYIWAIALCVALLRTEESRQ
jgi:hypothetical protein